MLEWMLPSWCLAIVGALAVPVAAAEPAQVEEAAPSSPEPTPTEIVSPEPAPTEASPEPAPTEAATPEPDEPEPEQPRTYPRLVIAGGPMLGPHAFGNEQCNSELAECQTKGSFFGLGGQIELRGRLWRPLYLHVRGLAVRNVSPNDPVYAGVLGAGAGLGAYARRIFGRAEYQYVHALGDNHFEPPFFDGEVATDDWGHHAGMIAVGFRQPLPRNLYLELWGGLMLGPSSVRRVAQEEPDERRLTTFQVGLNLAWDAWR